VSRSGPLLEGGTACRMMELNSKCPEQLKAFHECMDYYR